MTPAEACLLDRAAIEARQWQQLRTLLAVAQAGDGFYARKLRGVTVESLREFGGVPFTRKADLVCDQETHPPYGSNLTEPLERYTRYCQTSGTTGRPMRWLDTPESWEWMTDCWIRIYRAAGVGSEDRAFFAFSFGPFLGFWVGFDAAIRLGCLAIPGGGMRSAVRLETILDNRVTVLCCTPTYALRLAEVAAEEGIDLGESKVRRIIVAGEPGGSIPATRSRIEALWPGGRVVDHHGMTETGPVSYECPERRGVLHILELAYIPEVVDSQTLEPVGPGGTGELVLTNLGRTGSPLLRYRTGDIVRRAAVERCPCGSCELALEGGILARSDEMVVVRGVNLYPSAVEEVVRSCGVAEFRVETYTERELKEMSVEVEPAGPVDTAALCHRVTHALQSAFGLRVSVSWAAPGTLPRFEAKARRWVQR
jgi:phenylacetate-CoA ligase